MSEAPPADRDGIGLAAVLLGLVAVVCAVIPVIGEVVAALPALVAIGLGVLGVRRHELGRSRRAAASVCGAVLGAVALMITGLLFAVSHMG